MKRERLALRAGERFEFWARGRRAGIGFRVEIGGETIYQIAALPPFFEHFVYRHREACDVDLEWDPDVLEVSLFYSYDPATVAEEGVTFWEFGPEAIARYGGAAIAEHCLEDPARPRLHFSPFMGWMNDPNGLCRVEGRYHLFYQYHPNGTDWGPMHWGHATSPDLHTWTHLPVFLHPAQNLARLGATGGAFSGSAFQAPDHDPVFYYTERLPAYHHTRGYRETQKRAIAGPDLIETVAVETVLDTWPAGVDCDFRDPKVWYDEERQAYRMVLGASLDGDPAVLLYGSADGLSWNYLGPLYRAPAHLAEHGARSVECPDFFPLGDRWVLIMGFVGYTDPDTGRHNLLYGLVGDFRGDRFAPVDEGLQELDFGTDFYALQSFEVGDRRLAFAWLFNWEFRKPAGSPYSGEMSLPRELTLGPNNRLRMTPARELGKAWSTRPVVPNERGQIETAGRPFDVAVSGELEGLTLTCTGGTGGAFVVMCRDGRLTITVPEDDGHIHYRSAPADFHNVRVVFDRGVIEVFANDGEVCGTRRTYAVADPVAVTVEPQTDRAVQTSISVVE